MCILHSHTNQPVGPTSDSRGVTIVFQHLLILVGGRYDKRYILFTACGNSQLNVQLFSCEGEISFHQGMEHTCTRNNITLLLLHSLPFLIGLL